MSYFFILFIQLLSTCHLFQNPKSDIKLSITNCLPQKGKILVALYTNDKGFPGNDKLCFKSFQLKASEGSITIVTLNDIPPGEYAISVFQDENNDGILNTNFMGIPKEGYGFSNNAHNPFGPPDFKDCLVLLKGENNLSIKLKRW